MRELIYQLRTRVMTNLLGFLAREAEFRVHDIPLYIEKSTHHPAPFLRLGIFDLQNHVLSQLPAKSHLLELGTGSGYWALKAAQLGFQVTATDIESVSLEPVKKSARELNVVVECVHSNLFSKLENRRFDFILFNPPFHDEAPRHDAEKAWLGGPVVRGFLSTFSQHLNLNGAVYIVLPKWEQRRYADALAAFDSKVAATKWVPLLGRIDILELKASSQSNPLSAPKTMAQIT